MHRCDEFRERITERILDGVDLTGETEMIVCPACSEFYAQSVEVMLALDDVDAELSSIQWDGIEERLCRAIQTAAAHGPDIRARRFSFQWAPLAAAAAALAVVVAGLSWIPAPEPAVPRAAVARESAAERVALDPVTVDFLERSELLLRNVMKIEPGDAEDLAEAKRIAARQLPELKQRKQAAAAAPPVVRVMDTYETILRDLRNMDRRNTGEDISDIQTRIQRNGLIGGIKSFQPEETEVLYVFR